MQESFYSRVKAFISPPATRPRSRRLPALHILTEVSFALFVGLSLVTPSWRYGPFTWWPLWEYELLAGAPVKIGLFNVLPALIVAGWLAGRVLDGQTSPAWRWGRPAITLPLLGLTLLGLLTLNPAIMRRTFIHGGGLAITWLVYLYVINERPRLTVPFALIVVIQAGVAIVQFALQRDLGLVALGELPLNPLFEGVTVLSARGRPWLRAYGLTAHPNLLGALLATLLLLLLPLYGRLRGWRQIGVMAVISVGTLGLLVSFSRAAWLGLATGILTWFILSGRLTTVLHRQRLGNFHQRSHPKSHSSVAGRRACPELVEGSPVAPGKQLWRPLIRRLLLLLPLLPLLLLLWLNYDLVLSRFVALDSDVEAESVSQRLEDARTALKVIADHPLLGVGLGNYVYAALHFDPEAGRVHNVPLFVAAELGIIGGLLWLWLALAPFWDWLRQKVQSVRRLNPNPNHPLTPAPLLPCSPAQLAPWAAMIVMSMFDTMMWWSSNWQTAILFALLAAHLTWDITNTTGDRRLVTGDREPIVAGRRSPVAGRQL